MKQIITGTILFVLSVLSLSAQEVNRAYKTFADTSYKVGDHILAPQILFDVYGCNMIAEAKDSVKVIGDFIARHPSFIIEIGVHDEIKSEMEENVQLSKCRAQSIMAYLTKKMRVPKKNFEAKGYGSSEPLIGDDIIRTAAKHRDYLNQKNKRVEIKILYTN